MNKDTSTDCRSCVYFNCRKYNGIDYDYINWCRHFQEELEDFIPCKNLTLSRHEQSEKMVDSASSKSCSVEALSNWKVVKKHYAGKESYLQGLFAAKYRRDCLCKWDFL